MRKLLFTLFTLINVLNVGSIRLLNIPINEKEIIPMKAPEINIENDLIGGLDNHGCMPGAGYFYCNYTDTCNRFYEPCKFNQLIEEEVPEIPVSSEEQEISKDYSEIYVLIDLEELLKLL